MKAHAFVLVLIFLSILDCYLSTGEWIEKKDAKEIKRLRELDSETCEDSGLPKVFSQVKACRKLKRKRKLNCSKLSANCSSTIKSILGRSKRARKCLKKMPMSERNTMVKVYCNKSCDECGTSSTVTTMSTETTPMYTSSSIPVAGDQIVINGGFGAPINGGLNIQNTSEVLRNDMALKCNIPTLPSGMAQHASAAIPNGIVVCGGWRNYRSCWRLTPENEWVLFPSTRQSMYQFDLFYVNGKLWAIGPGNYIEYIDPAVGTKWSPVPNPSRNTTFKASCTAELPNNRVIVTGGTASGTGKDYKDGRETWIFETTTRTWTKGPSMRKPRYDHGCFPIYKNNVITDIVVVGGTCQGLVDQDPDCSKNFGFLNSSEVLSLADMTWSNGPDLAYTSIGNQGVPSIQDDYLGYSVGGEGRSVDGRFWDRYQEVWGLKKSNGTLEWVFVTNMTIKRSFHSAVKVPISMIPSLCGN